MCRDYSYIQLVHGHWSTGGYNQLIDVVHMFPLCREYILLVVNKGGKKQPIDIVGETIWLPVCRAVLRSRAFL